MYSVGGECAKKKQKKIGVRRKRHTQTEASILTSSCFVFQKKNNK